MKEETEYTKGFNDCRETVLKLVEGWDIEFKNRAIEQVRMMKPSVVVDYDRPIIKSLLGE